MSKRYGDESMRTSKFSRVRYLRVSRMAIEIAHGLSDEAKAQFLDQSLEWFLALEHGEEIQMVETDNSLLNLALREEIAELEEGYGKYMQAVRASKGTDSADVPPMDTPTDTPTYPIEEKKSGTYEIISPSESSEEMRTGRPFSELELQSINSALSYAGITPDNQFYTFARKAGYRITIDSIRKARDEKSRSLAYVVKLMKESNN